MSRLFGELSGRRPGEGQGTDSEETDPKQERPAARIPQALVPDSTPPLRPPIEVALRRELENVRAELERQKTLGSDRDRILREREDKFRSQAQELETAFKRVAVLEDRQRQFTEKIRTTEGELAVSRASANGASEALEYERQLRSADAGRISDMEAEVSASRTRLAAMQEDRDALARRLESLERDNAGRVKLLQDELDGLRLREAASAKQGRDMAGRLRVLEPALQAAQAEAKAAREGQAAAAGREEAAAARLSGIESKLGEESALRTAAESGMSALSEKCAGLMKEVADLASVAERAAALEGELQVARERVSVLEDRQRQFAEKLRLNEADRQTYTAEAKASREALEAEKESHRATAGSLREVEARLRETEERIRERERALGTAEDRSAAMAGELAEARRMFRETEAARESLARSERDLAARCQALEKECRVVVAERDLARQESQRRDAVLQGQEAEAKSVREAQSAAACREAAAAAHLSEIESKLSKESALRAAAESGRIALSEKCAGLMKEVEKANGAAVEARERARELEVRVVKAQTDAEALRKTVAELEAAAAVRIASAAREEVQPAVAASAPAEGRGWMSAIPAGAVVATVAVLCSAAFLGGMLMRSRDTVLAVRAEPIRPVSVEKGAVPPAVPPSKAPVEWPVLRVDGVQVSGEADLRTLVFERGIFIKYAEIGLAARDVLRALASQMKPCMGRLVLEIEGHTDSDPIVGHPVYVDNVALGKARAGAVLAFLRDDCGLPAASMTATSAGSDRPPYPNDSAENRSRNRTVVLRLRSAQ